MDRSFADLFHLVLPCDEHAPARVRAELDGIDAIGPVREQAKLIASELVSNAVRHAGCTAGDELDVHCRCSAELLEIAVHDPARSQRVPNVRQDPEIGGLGLVIVEHVSHRWGTLSHGGRVVWAQLVLPAEPAPPAAEP